MEITWTLPAGFQAANATAQTVINASDLTAVKQVAAGATGLTTVTTTQTAAPLGDLTMSLVINPSSDAPPGPDPAPDPGPTPGTAYKYAKINGSTFTISGVNPGSTGGTGGDAAYSGYRGPNQLILYTDPTVTITVTNQYGTEVSVNSSNVITAVSDRQASASGTGTSVPSGGYVLSGHGTARDWLNSNATVSATVTLLVETDPNPTPGPDPDPVTPGSAYPVRAISIYKMIWSSSGAAPVGSLPSGCNVVRLAFAQGSPPTLVGGGPEGSSAMYSALGTWRNAGKKVVVSIGGAGGAVNTGDRTSFMSGIASIRSALAGASGGGLDGLDWDIEASGLNQSDIVWISTQLKQIYGSSFAISFAPNGGNVGKYLPAAVACYKAGACDDYGQQFYDASVSLSAAKGRISEALGAGLPQSVMSVGMMIASDSNHWTNSQCRTYMSDIRSTWPGITKAYLWEASRSGTSQWASDMVSVIGA